MIIKEIPFDNISLNMGEIYLGMGLGGPEDCAPDSDILVMIDQLLEEIARVCRPCFGYKIMPITCVERKSVTLGAQTLNTGSVITKYITDADSIALFIATSGVAFDRWLHDVKNEGDIVKQFLADAIGSEIAEATARLMSEVLAEEQQLIGNKTSNSYSPGYCGWNVTEQRGLFSMLPESPCGVTLSDSALMTPIKSVSGVIAIGPNVQKMPYGCEICGMKTCFKKRHLDKE